MASPTTGPEGGCGDTARLALPDGCGTSLPPRDPLEFFQIRVQIGTSWQGEMPKVEVATRSARPLPALEGDVCSGGRNIQKKEKGSGRPI